MHPVFDLDNLFSYHTLQADQQADVQALHKAAQAIIKELCYSDHALGPEVVDARTKAFAKLVLEVTPPGADQSAAIRSIRLLRYALNESRLCSRLPGSLGSPYQRCIDIAAQHAMLARWQAVAAIAHQ